MEKIYKVKTRNVFEGTFEVKASDKEEAARLVLNDCGMVMCCGIQTTLNDDKIDWHFDIHPEKKIVSITTKK